MNMLVPVMVLRELVSTGRQGRCQQSLNDREAMRSQCNDREEGNERMGVSFLSAFAVELGCLERCSDMKTTGRSFRRPFRCGSQHPHGRLQPSVTVLPEDLNPPLASPGIRHMCCISTYEQAKHPYTYKKKKTQNVRNKGIQPMWWRHV